MIVIVIVRESEASVLNLPKGTRVEIHNYDTPRYKDRDDPTIHRDEYGDLFCKDVFTITQEGLLSHKKEVMDNPHC